MRAWLFAQPHASSAGIADANEMILRPSCRYPMFHRTRFDALITTKPTLTVCLLDDDPSVLNATKRLLLSEGWRVETFTNPNAFLDHVKISHPRVVVIDMFMPGLNGLEVQRRLSEYSPATRVIVLTANGDNAVRWTALAAGAVAFFVKPARCDDFIASIRSASTAS